MNRLESQTLALAGMFQAATLVDDLAQSGQCHDAACDCSLDSLFTFDAATTQDVFGDIFCLRLGFESIQKYLAGEGGAASKNIAYYVLSMLKIASRLQRDGEMSDELSAGLREIEREAAESAQSRTEQTRQIDQLYRQTISKLTPRVMVRGDQRHLAVVDTAARIRSLLLAGVRAAVLWQQLGGSRWRLLFSRRKYLTAARKFLSYH